MIHKNLSHRPPLAYRLAYTCPAQAMLGRPGDHLTTVGEFAIEGGERRWISGVKVRVVEHAGSEVVGGLVLHWTDGAIDRLGVGEEEALALPLLEVPQDQHIAYVYGSSGWFVDRLAFVLSSGKLLGDAELGGDGGVLRQHTLCLLRQQFNATNLHLDGVKGKVVRSQGVELVTNLRFVYRVAADQALEAQEMEEGRGGAPQGGLVEDLGSEESVDSEHSADPEDFEVDVSDGEQADIHDMEDEGDQVDYDD